MIDYNINKKEIKQIYNYVKNNYLLFNEDCIKYLSDVINELQYLFCDVSILRNIINITLSYNTKMEYTDYLFIARKLYSLNVSAIPTENEFKNFFDIYKLVLGIVNSNFINSGLRNINHIIENVNFIYNLFENKNLIKIIFKEIDSLTIWQFEIPKLLSHLKNYINKSRMYYNDELVYVSSINNFLDSIKFHIEDNDKIQDLISKQLSFDKRLAGIYDIDEDKIKELEDKTNKLENKLDYLNKSADQNSDSYRQIEEETKKLLDDISKVRKRENAKSFKIVGINEEAERNRLLQKVKKYNKDFRFNITNTMWFCQEVIEKIGIEYVANSYDRFSQSSILIAYQNNQIDELSQVLKLNHNFVLRTPCLLKENIKLFEIPFIADNFNGDYLQELVLILSLKKETYLLKQILETNPNFKIFDSYFINYINKELIERLTVDYIANSNASQQNTIRYFCNSFKLSKLIDILKIKPDFYIYTNGLINEMDLATINWCALENEIDILIKNFSAPELIDFFDLDSSNLCKLYVLIYNLIRSDNGFKISETTTEFTNLDPIYRKKALAMKFNKYDSDYIAILYKNLVKKNNKTKEKRLIKK